MVQVRQCVGCGCAFTTRDVRKTRCKKNCGVTSKNPTRDARREPNDITFVGVDGEGVDRPDGAHEYVMLSVGSKTLFRDGCALTPHDIFTFLWACYTEQPDVAYVGFFLNYDFIQWEKLLPEDVARSLLTDKGILARKSANPGRKRPHPDPVVWDGWELDIMAGRRWRLRPHVCVKSKFADTCRTRTCGTTLVAVGDEPCCIGAMDATPPDLGAETRVASLTEVFRAAARNCPHSVPKRLGTTSGGGYQWMYICDTGPFWQTSFLNVINPAAWDHDPPCTQEEYEIVKKGKDDRGLVADYGDTSYADEMTRYNVLENDLLARVTQRLNRGFMADEHIRIRLGRNEWYGPGRAAQLWMDGLSTLSEDPDVAASNRRVVAGEKRANGGSLRNEDVFLSVPPWAVDAARESYYGGWFEQMVHGHCGLCTWEYDINSAYPAVIATLPCLHVKGVGVHNGTWSQGVGRPPRDVGYCLVLCTVQGSNPYIGAMPHRTSKGNIIRPHLTRGWYWAHELAAAVDAGLIDSIDVEKWVAYDPCTCGYPFNPELTGIERMYNLRLQVGKNSPQGKGFKLVYNSAYGKCAQSIGSPKYANPVYASLITAGCRTQILQAIASHPMGAQAVTMVATDGVYFTEPHPRLPLHPTRLGAWDSTEKHHLTQLMPGIYWDDSTREAVRGGRVPKLKSRGVNGADLAAQVANLDRAFASLLADPGGVEWPSLTMTVKFLLTSAKLALHNGDWSRAGRVQHGVPRKVSSNPSSKRESLAYVEGGMVRTRPYAVGPTVDTVPYQRSFGYAEFTELDNLFNGMVSIDGEDPSLAWVETLTGRNR